MTPLLRHAIRFAAVLCFGALLSACYYYAPGPYYAGGGYYSHDVYGYGYRFHPGPGFRHWHGRGPKHRYRHWRHGY